MKVSVGLPTAMEGMMYPVPFATVDDLIAISKLAEKLGFHSVWGNDHMTTQQYVQKSFSTPPNFYEVLITFAYIAAVTEKLRFGTGMLVTPMRRDLVVAAKQIATLDVFSKGRLMIGIGVGAYREEFEALNPGVNVHRGQMVAESLEALRLLFTQRNASFDGNYYHFRDVEMYPKPVQDPFPFYLGGNSIDAMQRAARFAEGWMPAILPKEELVGRITMIRDMLNQENRNDFPMDIAPQYVVCIGKTREEAIVKFHASQMYHHLVSLGKSTLKDQDLSLLDEMNLIGTVDDIHNQIKGLEAIGVTHLCGTYFVSNTVPELLDQMQIFAEEIMTRI